jgi:hypothetical protein
MVKQIINEVSRSSVAFAVLRQVSGKSKVRCAVSEGQEQGRQPLRIPRRKISTLLRLYDCSHERRSSVVGSRSQLH